MPDLDTVRYLNITDTDMTLYDKSGFLATLIAIILEFEVYREIHMFLIDFNVSETTLCTYPPIVIIGNLLATVTNIDNRFYKSSNYFAMILYQYLDRVNLYGIYIEQYDALEQFTFLVQDVRHIDVKNITLNSTTFTGTKTDAVLFFNTFDGGLVTIDGLYILNSNLGFRDTFYFIPSGVGDLYISHAYYENVTISVGASLIKSESARNLVIENCTFKQVKQASLNDNTNNMIDLGTLYLDSDGEFRIENILVTDSSIPILKMGAIAGAGEYSNSILFSNISYIDSTFDFFQDLIAFGSIKSDENFEMILTEITMKNLTFVRSGDLLKFQHQTATPVKLLNSYFANIYGGSIYLESANLQNTALKTKVEIANITAEHIEGGANSFIHSNEGAELTVTDSKFTCISSNGGGAVINSGYQNSITEFYHCAFINNTALNGGVANVQDGSLIRFRDCLMANNFALQAGVIESQSDGYFEMFR